MNIAVTDLSLTPWRRVMLSAKRDTWCLVDAVDYDWLAAWGWNLGGHVKRDDGYAKRNVGVARSTLYMHRELLTRHDPRPHELGYLHGDHVNGCTLDNRRCNLRWLTRSENLAHRPGRRHISVADVLAELLAGWRGAPGFARALEAVPF